MRRVRLLLILVCLITAPSIRGGDVDDLKDTHEQVVRALNMRNADAYVASWHHRGVQLRRNAELPTDYEQVGKAAIHQGLQNFFANTERFTVTWLEPQYRVIGSTGIVWGRVSGSRKPTGRPAETWTSRATVIYVKLDSGWARVCSHMSAPPSGN